MWAGSPAPTKPAGGRTPTQRCDVSLDIQACRFSRVLLPLPPRTPRLGPCGPRRGASSPRLPPSVAAAIAGSSKDVVPPIVSYTVQKGETLWDIAVQHGVSMRTIKDLNKLPGGSEPVLTEGQQLLVPASGITAVAALDAPASAAALGSTPARGLWVGSDHVRLASVGEAKELYLRQCDRGNSQNTVLVLYAPWCPHCRDMEDELERLAEGLSHVPAVRVVAVNADCVEGRMFAREVLGVAYYPSIISFPAHSRTFFKYKGRHRDAESLLRFLNMTCCAREDQMWALRPAGTHTAVLVTGGKWVNQLVPVGTTPGALATAVGLLALLAATAAAVMAARRRAAVAAAGPSGAVEAEVVAELDSSLGRMAVLMLRAVWTRVALLLGLVGPSPAPAEDAAAAPAAPAAAAEPAAAAVSPASSPAAPSLSPSPAALAAQRRRAVRSGGGGGSDCHGLLSPPNGTMTCASEPSAAAPAVVLPPSSSPSYWDSSRVRASHPAAAEPVTSPAALRSGGGGGAVATTATAVAVAPAAVATTAAATTTAAAAASYTDAAMVAPRELTAEERMRLTRLTDDELIALVNSDPDLDKVLSRLLGDK